MKHLQIEQVKNGWIVRPYTEAHCGGAVVANVFVYTTVESLQAALPDLLKTKLPAIEKYED